MTDFILSGEDHKWLNEKKTTRNRKTEKQK